MPLLPPICLVDSSGQQWIVTCDNNAILTTIPVSGLAPAFPALYLNSVSDGTSYSLTVIGNPPPAGTYWGQLQTSVIPNGSHPTQSLITAPNGVVYAIQIATVGPPVLGSTSAGILQTALPVDTSSVTCTTPISILADNVLQRLEETPPGIFWNEQWETYTAVVEAMNDWLMLVGRPTQTVGMQFNLTPNSVWQQMPKGLYLISDIWGPQTRLRKYTLFDYDYSQSASGSDWENDSSPTGPTSWAPCGMGMFIVHPAPASAMTVLLDGVAYPVAETNFPYTGAELVPFHHEMFEYLEMYAAHIGRLKEGSSEFQESMSLYKSYLEGAKRFTEIESRKDPLIFSTAFGAPAGVNSIVRR